MNKLFLQVLNTSILSSILISIIIIANNKFLIKYSYTFNYFLSIMVIFRMLFISKIKLSVPIVDKIFTNTENVKNLNYNILKLFQNNEISSNYLSILSTIWILGVILIILYYAYFQFTFYLKLNSRLQIDGTNNFQSLLNIQNKNIEVKILNGVPSPLVIGILKNTIILPNNNYTKKELKWIFYHEFIHIKRKDNLLKLLMIFTLAIHWFNPFIYILKNFFTEQCELSCDEQVIKNIEVKEIKEYALLLINVVKYKNNLKTSAISSKLVNKKINLTKRRITSMLNSKTKKKGTFIAAISLFLIGGTIFAFADSPKDHGIENYTFTKTPEDAKEIPNKEEISEVTLKSDSIEVEYNNSKKQEFNNKDYSLNLKVAE